VFICCKGQAGRSGNTVVSTADISAYIAALGDDDSEEIFARDTLESGASIADERLVRLLADRSGPAVLDLERLGIPLLRDGDHIDRTRGAGHSRARTYRADSKGLGPNKGLALSVPLVQKARELGAQVFDRTPVVDLLSATAAVTGAIAIDLDRNQTLRIRSGAVIAASGGFSHLFARTNGTADATGDLVALGLRAGAVARDLEFVQWHPTRMDQPVPLFLTNGLLADGAVFRDREGREFMGDYDARANLAPRDVLAKGIFREAQSGHGVDGGVYLDCSAIPPDRIALRHAYLEQTLQKHGVDFPRDWLVVSPSTHFSMGGLTIDVHAASSMPGLFVAGETAGGIHGANRLGGNAFCEGLVFGTIAGEAAAEFARATGTAAAGDDGIGIARLVDPNAPDPRPALTALWLRLRQDMWRDAAIVRDADSLKRVEHALAEISDEAASLRSPSVRDAARLLELQAAVRCAQLVVATALFRQESRGAHWRSDFPATDDAWYGHTSVQWRADQAQPQLHFIAKARRAARLQTIEG
jgi:aspartate oxidase